MVLLVAAVVDMIMTAFLPYYFTLIINDNERAASSIALLVFTLGYLLVLLTVLRTAYATWTSVPDSNELFLSPFVQGCAGRFLLLLLMFLIIPAPDWSAIIAAMLTLIYGVFSFYSSNSAIKKFSV